MLKKFFWRITFCTLPIVLCALIVGTAWHNYTNDSETGLRFNLGVDLAGGTILVYEVDSDWWNDPQHQNARIDFQSADLAAALKRRIDPNNLMEIVIRPVDTEPPRVEIILPMKSAGGGTQGQADIERVKSIIGQVGKLEFRILADTRDDGAAIDEARALVDDFVSDERNTPPAPLGFTWMQLEDKAVRELETEQGGVGLAEGFQTIGELVFHHSLDPARTFVLSRDPPEGAEVTGEDVARARPDIDQMSGNWVVLFGLQPAAGSRMYDLTQPAVKRMMATILDSKVASYANINEPLRDNIQVTMGGAGPGVKDKVDELVLILRSGALPATLKPQPVSELTMGPGLGQDTIDKGTMAITFGFLAVVVFMMIYYRFAGVVATISLFTSLLLTIGFMVAVKATFTLPGLAGLVLMVGMAVDANVLIFERIREERDRGSSLPLAIRNGYDRAFSTIIDTHLTSIFTAIVLYVVGNDQLKGFGVSLTAGLIISLFSSLYLSRFLFELAIAMGKKELSMMRLLTKTNINFMRVRNAWFTATVVLSVLGVIIFGIRGEDGLNIDFTGGTAYHVVFKEPTNIETVRQEIAESLPNVSVDAIYRTGSQDADPREFTFRTKERDPIAVRKAVADTFGPNKEDSQLEWVDVTIGEITPVEGEDVQLNHQIETTFSERDRSAPAEIARIVDGWMAKEYNVPKPDDFYFVEGVGDSQDGLYERITLKYGLPIEENVEEAGNKLKSALASELNQPRSERLENFDSQLANETQEQALYAIALSWLAVCMYLWFRFGNWTFGIAAVLCLVHDLMFAIGLIGICHWLVGTPIGSVLLMDDFKLDLAAIAALLTLVGYSVNDTIVVFDRIREVRGKSPVLTPEMINESINQTLSRTILTGVTTLLVVVVLYVFGGEGVHLFSYIMIVGVLIGTYSSIYVASPLLLIFGEGKVTERTSRRQLAAQEVKV